MPIADTALVGGTHAPTVRRAGLCGVPVGAPFDSGGRARRRRQLAATAAGSSGGALAIGAARTDIDARNERVERECGS